MTRLTKRGAILYPLFLLAACQNGAPAPDEPAQKQGAGTEAAPDAPDNEAPKKSVLKEAVSAVVESAKLTPIDTEETLPENARVLVNYEDLRDLPIGVLKLTGDKGETCVASNWLRGETAFKVNDVRMDCTEIPAQFVEHELLLNEGQILKFRGLLEVKIKEGTCVINNAAWHNTHEQKGEIGVECHFNAPDGP